MEISCIGEHCIAPAEIAIAAAVIILALCASIVVFNIFQKDKNEK